jgi:NitT/TauT family transport system substrate-binding protein
MKRFAIAGLALALIGSVPFAHAGQSVSLILNWTPAADHSPFYYAKAQGWYEKAGIDLSGGSRVRRPSSMSAIPRARWLTSNISTPGAGRANSKGCSFGKGTAPNARHARA